MFKLTLIQKLMFEGEIVRVEEEIDGRTFNAGCLVLQPGAGELFIALMEYAQRLTYDRT